MATGNALNGRPHAGTTHVAQCTILAFAFFAASLSALAADLVIGAGQSETVSGTCSYGAIECNGALVVEDNAVVSCTSFAMARGASVTQARVDIGNDVRLTIASGGECLFGVDGGGGELTLGTNSVFTVGMHAEVQYLTSADLFSAEDPFPETAKIRIHLKNGSTLKRPDGASGIKVLSFGRGATLSYGSYGRFVGSIVQLDEGSALKFGRISMNGRPDIQILFNGGSICSDDWGYDTSGIIFSNVWTWQGNITGAKMYLTGTNRNDVVLDMRNRYASWFSAVDAGIKFVVNGDGGLVFRGTEGKHDVYGTPRFFNAVGGWAPRTIKSIFDMSFPGRIALEGRTHIMMASWGAGYLEPGDPLPEILPSDNAVEIGSDAGLVFNGESVFSCSRLNSLGNILNDGEGLATLTLTGDGNSKIVRSDPNVAVVKNGTGSLAIGPNVDSLASVSVNAGNVVLDNALSDETNVRICELALGANCTCTTEYPLGRPVCIERIAMDASASVSVGTFVPVENGSLDMRNFPYPDKPVALPFEMGKVIGKDALNTWSLYFDSVLSGSVGAAVPCIASHAGHLMLGRWGMILVFR